MYIRLICTHIHTHTRACACVCKHMCVSIYMYIYIHTTHTHIYTLYPTVLSLDFRVPFFPVSASHAMHIIFYQFRLSIIKSIDPSDLYKYSSKPNRCPPCPPSYTHVRARACELARTILYVQFACIYVCIYIQMLVCIYAHVHTFMFLACV